MTPQELTDLSVIVHRARESGWANNKPALLAFFADLAARERLSEVAQGFAIVAEGVPDAAPFLFETLPLVVATNYPPFASVDLLALGRNKPVWQEALSDALLDSGRFPAAVATVLAAA